MKIIIAGSGKVGFTLAEQLVRESHDVTIVDLKEAALRRAADMLDIMAVQGNGVSANVLREAGADSADLVVATTNSDEVNMVCSLVAKNLGAKYTIARIRNPEYETQLRFMRGELGLTMSINPEKAAAHDDAGTLLGQGFYNNGLGDISAVIQRQSIPGHGIRLLGNLIDGQEGGQCGLVCLFNAYRRMSHPLGGHLHQIPVIERNPQLL